ncbi:uncharacterized protein LOC134879338 [Eleginops maclovinus]|uniref:uncharacterized protein LOC134879338 n=1 Tax=Eleginops maclovinus TaxID=56733 RepID=UPI00308092E5
MPYDSLTNTLPGSPPKSSCIIIRLLAFINLVKDRATSRRAEESLSVASKDSPEMATSQPQTQPNDVMESLEREKKNAMSREKRAKTTVKGLLGDLREKNLINEELSEKLAFYSDLKMDFTAKQGHEYTQDCREFALTLHLHGPKAYKYLRETQHFPLPHPQTLQRWLRSVDAKPGLNKMMLDMLERRCQGDPAKYGCVSLMLDAVSVKKHAGMESSHNTHCCSVTPRSRVSPPLVFKLLMRTVSMIRSAPAGEMYTTDEFEKYCSDVEHTAAWGGHLELRALTQVLHLPMEVIQADSPPIKIGEEFDSEPITLIYMHHAYGLGEHYNSVEQLKDPANAEDS